MSSTRSYRKQSQSSNPAPASPPQPFSTPAPHAYALPQDNLKSRLVCVRCRERRVKCIPAPLAPAQPCERCLSKGIQCEYLLDSGLPYTQSPPHGMRPRYSGGAYPSLGLAAAEGEYWDQQRSASVAPAFGPGYPPPSSPYAPTRYPSYPATAAPTAAIFASDPGYPPMQMTGLPAYAPGAPWGSPGAAGKGSNG